MLEALQNIRVPNCLLVIVIYYLTIAHCRMVPQNAVEFKTSPLLWQKALIERIRNPFNQGHLVMDYGMLHIIVYSYLNRVIFQQLVWDTPIK